MRTIDLNADLGEGCGGDAALLEVVTSANVACGAHAGSPDLAASTVRAAAARGVAVGAHPGYPDPAHFGRVSLALSADDLAATLAAQIDVVAAACRAAGVALRHVKPHGALYNDAARDAALAALVARAARDAGVALVGLPASAHEHAAAAAGVRFVREGFADRAYRPDGTLVPRGTAGAVLHDAAAIAAGALRLASGSAIDTLCVHGDTPGAVAIASAVRDALAAAGVRVAALDG